MAKDPAFLFYPNDYIGGTMGMTFEEKGAYIELLMLQFNRGHMTSHMVAQSVGQIWDKIKDKFIKDEKGLYYNARLDEEIANRKNFTNSRRNNLSGKNQYSKKEDNALGHMTSHMENENKDISIVDNNIGATNFFYIGKETYRYAVSNFIKTEFQQFLEIWKMQNKECKVEEILSIMDKECVGTQFNDTEHIKNKFKFIAKDLLKPKNKFAPEVKTKASNPPKFNHAR
jgi:uncharacterized protein YdaU (DUF1376 family)